MLRPFFSFYGSKWRLAPKYPAPRYATIIEPFAGSAGYSLRYPEREVILIDRDPIVTGLWQWLIKASPDDILSLPVLKRGESLDDYDIPLEARWLMGFWINQTGATPNTKVTDFGSRSQRHERVARQLSAIRHWQVHTGDYSEAPETEATWFIDPPYEVEGRKYRYGPNLIDFGYLGEWCHTRKGQVIACENEGARWLPFEQFATHRGATYTSGTVYSTEVVWLSDREAA